MINMDGSRHSITWFWSGSAPDPVGVDPGSSQGGGNSGFCGYILSSWRLHWVEVLLEKWTVQKLPKVNSVSFQITNPTSIYQHLVSVVNIKQHLNTCMGGIGFRKRQNFFLIHFVEASAAKKWDPRILLLIQTLLVNRLNSRWNHGKPEQTLTIQVIKWHTSPADVTGFASMTRKAASLLISFLFPTCQQRWCHFHSEVSTPVSWVSWSNNQNTKDWLLASFEKKWLK